MHCTMKSSVPVARISPCRWLRLGTLMVAGLGIAAAGLMAQTYRWVDEPGKHRDLYHGERPVLRYVYEPLDTSSAAARERTYKPFHHVYAFDGKDFITKGPGGRFTHHRGIFYGFSRNTYTRPDGSTGRADTWHASGKAFQQHLEFLAQEATADQARLRTAIAWHGEQGEQFAREERELRVWHDAEDRLLIDFASTITTSFPQVRFDGDAQHAGFQFRAHDEVASDTASQTYYLRPDGIAPPGATRNPSNNPSPDRAEDVLCMNEAFKGMSFVVRGERYTVAYLDRPDNPKPAWYSERDYGRFGSYFITEITPAQPLTVRYRLVIQKGEMTLNEIAAHAAAQQTLGHRLQHVVAFKFLEDATPAQIREIEEAFAALKQKIPEIHHFEWGTNVSPEGLDKGFTHCFILTFQTEKDRDIYLEHPRHKEFVKLVGPVVADAFVIDFWAR
jgi:hypothetical protein